MLASEADQVLLSILLSWGSTVPMNWAEIPFSGVFGCGSLPESWGRGGR